MRGNRKRGRLGSYQRRLAICDPRKWDRGGRKALRPRQQANSTRRKAFRSHGRFHEPLSRCGTGGVECSIGVHVILGGLANRTEQYVGVVQVALTAVPLRRSWSRKANVDAMPQPRTRPSTLMSGFHLSMLLHFSRLASFSRTVRSVSVSKSTVCSRARSSRRSFASVTAILLSH